LTASAAKFSSARAKALEQSLVGSTPVMAQVRQLILQVAPTPATVLLLGETGTGKEVIANGIHACSDRANKPFIPVNCGAIPGELLESELFGHEKGAFTGAVAARKGRFELAEGGTLFLDEIGDMPFPMQVKLLRVLQERTFERVGSGKPQSCDVRIIAATHQHLEEKVANGEFRGDLFYRLNVFPIEVPPLRERTTDIPELVDRFLSEFAAAGQSAPKLKADALAQLTDYHWPGNIRELANLIERLAILYPGQSVGASALPPRYVSGGMNADWQPPEPNAPVQEDLTDLFAPPPPPLEESAEDLGSADASLWGNTAETPPLSWPIDLKQHLANLERDLIERALADADGVIAQAAKYLGLQRTTLVEKMKKHGVRRPDEAS
jgi:sigma-54 specific flagellar transcriptional regulator A